MCGWQVKLCDPSLTRVIPERLRGELLIIKRYTNRHFYVVRDSNHGDFRNFVLKSVHLSAVWMPVDVPKVGGPNALLVIN